MAIETRTRYYHHLGITAEIQVDESKKRKYSAFWDGKRCHYSTAMAAFKVAKLEAIKNSCSA